jgi:chromosome segregation ATPase
MLTLRVPSFAPLLMLIGLPLLASCATKGDLDHLKQEIQASSIKVEMLKGETKTGFQATKKQIDDREAKLAQDLKGLQEAMIQMIAALKEQHVRLAENSARDEALTKEAQELRAIVQSASRTVTEFLNTEEAKLKEGLRWVQSVLKGIAIDTRSADEKAREGTKEALPEEKK